MQLCQKVLLCWEGIRMNGVKCLWGRNASNILLESLCPHGKGSNYCGSPGCSGTGESTFPVFKEEEKLLISVKKLHDSHILSTYPVFPWLLPNLNHLLTLQSSRNSLTGRRRVENAFWQGVINILSWRGLGQTVNFSSIREYLPALSAPLCIIRCQPHKCLVRICRKTWGLYWRLLNSWAHCSFLLKNIKSSRKGGRGKKRENR